MDDSSLTSSDNEVFTIYYLKYLHKGKISDTIEVANFVNNIVIVKVFKSCRFRSIIIGNSSNYV